MTNIIDILIKAQWLGGAALHGTEGDLRKLGNSAAQTSVEMAVMKEKAAGLNRVLGGLAEQVVLGNMTVEEATKLYEDFTEELGDLGIEAAPAATGGLKSLVPVVGAVTAAIAVGTIAAKKFYSALREGAELEYVQGRFDRLAVSIGTTGNALRTDLRYATQGMATDAELMAIATDLMSQGLADSHDEAARLAGVVVELDINTNQLMNTLAEQTTTQFDAMGISVDGFEVKLNKLEKAGYDTDEAFKFAFMEQAEELIERVGSRAETTAGQLDVLESTWENMKDTAKLLLLQPILPFVESAVVGKQIFRDLDTAAADAARSIGDVTAQRDAVRAFADELRKMVGGEARPLAGEIIREDLANIAAAVIFTSDTIEDQQSVLENYGFTVEGIGANASVILEGHKVAWEDIEEAISNMRLEAQASWDLSERLAAQSGYILAEPVEKLTEEMQGLKEQVEAIEFDKMLDDVGMTSDEFVRLAYNMGGIAPATEHLEKLQEIFTSITSVSDEFTASLERQDRKLAQLGATAYDFMPAEEYKEARLDFWLDFQTDMDNVTIKEGEKREGAEQRYEERRTDIVERHGLRRAQGEEDFMRGRARSEAKHLASIEDIREDDTDRQLELRDSANQRLSDLERDHIARMAEIVENADIQLTEAAGRLDAAAVVSLTRQRDDALQDERDSYERSRSDIQRQLDEQLRAERETAEERIIEMTEFHEERKRQEDEDRQIRLDRSEDAYQEQLGALDDKHKQELIDIYNQASIERYQKEVQYQQDYTQLDDSYRGRSILHDEWMAKILKKEEDWWTSRLGLVGGGAEGSPDLPSQFFGGMGPSVGDISIIINGAESPQESGDAVRQELEKLFGSFGDRPGV